MSNSRPRGAGLGFEGKLGLLGMAIVLSAAILWTARGPRPEKVDFITTYLGATIVAQGQAGSLYSREVQTKVRDQIFSDPNPLLFEHPPFEAFLFSPLAKVPYRTAYLIWGLLSAGALLAVVFWLRPYCPWPTQDLGYICLWLLFAPAGVALFQGQTSLLVLAVFAATFIQLTHNREFNAGLLFGLALFKLQLAVPFALIFLFRKKWNFLAGFASTASVLGAVSIWAVGIQGIVQYARFLKDISDNPQDLSYGSAVDMGSIFGFAYATLGHSVGHRVLSIGCAVLCVALLWFVARRWKAQDETMSTDLMFAAAVAITLAVGFHMFTHDFSPLMLSMLLAANAFFLCRCSNGKDKFVLGSARAILILFWVFPIYFLLVAAHALYLFSAILVAFAFLLIHQASLIEKPEPVIENRVAVG